MTDPIAQGYELLLGAPLASFDARATYALYHWDDLHSEGFAWKASTLKQMLEPSKKQRARDGDAKKPNGLGWDRFAFDLGQSLFSIEDVEGKAGATLKKAAGKLGVVTGRELATILSKLGGVRALMDEEEEAEDLFITVLGRIRTDGTLRDAMAAATWTMSAPKGLSAKSEYAEVDPKWQKRLAAIDDAKVRPHFEMLCQTAEAARCTGALFRGDRCPGDLRALTKLGHKPLVGWEFGEGQAAQVVVQLAKP